ncbi:DUF998 domain-containing protein [Brevibacterium aurantiacum]|uniref:DUF998 domain-containing protein n=1 Tax=Brevibacterium aurantiacum TaxID=273384 RepID=A0A556C400_BREAU|nr:DUF998 domain-containing protein [Brevibacterium aurantiacum]TSI12132.1 DUF998 domain-containing protein [Brevibacterium aurantiacum]
MTHLLFIVASVLFAIRILLLLALHLIPSGINPVRDTVSDYAVSDSPRTRSLSSAASRTAAAAWIALGAAVLLRPPTTSGPSQLGFWLIVLGLVLAVMPYVPTDRTGTSVTLRGRLHFLLAIAWFTIAYSTIGPLAHLLEGLSADILDILNFCAGAALFVFVVSLILPALRRYTFGISERAFILAVTVAPLIASATLITA